MLLRYQNIAAEDCGTLAALGRVSNLLPSQLHQDLNSLPITSQRQPMSAELLEKLQRHGRRREAHRSALRGTTFWVDERWRDAELTSAPSPERLVELQLKLLDGGGLASIVGPDHKVIRVSTKSVKARSLRLSCYDPLIR